jgi:hypothetical protein
MDILGFVGNAALENEEANCHKNKNCASSPVQPIELAYESITLIVAIQRRQTVTQLQFYNSSAG